MDDLVAFLHARLNEDERVARSALLGTHGEWQCLDLGKDMHVEYALTGPRVAALGATEWPGVRGRAVHIARHDPARVLREVEANRRLLDAHRPIDSTRGADYPPLCKECSHGPDEYYTVDYPCLTVRLLALPYADHEDYREEWRP